MLALQELTEIFTAIPFNRMLGLKLEEVMPNYITMSFTMKKELIGNFLHGILHGGVISSVIDMAGGVAVMMAAIQKHQNKSIDELKDILGKSSTIDLSVNFIRPGKGEQFLAKAYALHSGKRISFSRIELYNQEQSLIATGSATYLIG